VQRKGLLLVVLFVAATTGFGLLGPYLMGRAIDGYIMKGDLSGLARIAFLMIAIYITTAVTTWLQAFIMAGVSQRAVRDIRKDLFGKLQTLSLSFFDKQPHGELMSRLANDVENISNVLNESIVQFITGILMVIGVATAMFLLNVRLALVSMATIPFMVLITKFMATRTRKGYRRQQKTLGEMNGLIEETITGARIVKAYGREQNTVEKFDKTNQTYRENATMAQTYITLFGPVMGFINNMAFLIIACAGGIMAVWGLVSVGIIATFLSYSRHFIRPLNHIASLYNTIQSALAGAERVFQVLDEVPELTDNPEAPSLEDIRGEVLFRDVCFGYEEDQQVLKEVTLRAEPGQTIALVGPTGAGKTTIINLLTRFYDIDSGSISIDGKDIRKVQKDSLRRQLGIVLQDTFLFSASVMENIRYGRLDAEDAEVVAAANLAGADAFIRHLPKGYDTRLTERGGNLSLGQRQLLAIARAVLADPAILILDEATSSVDTRTEIRIQEALLRLMQGRTSFVIAHRLSTIRDADQVLVIDDGRIIEKGSHNELLEQHGFYHNMYMSQFKRQEKVIIQP
ncbi:MAG: ABC transporter ATP-binding protein, partial [Deltaproteobacteria bacterium]|nr:ABC transporter ATP-binding protein [Deltaproteobacteria bacterium]